jgi:hypothetical protein
VTSGGSSSPSFVHVLGLTLVGTLVVVDAMRVFAGELRSRLTQHTTSRVDPLRCRGPPWITIPPRRQAGSLVGVGQYPAAKWISLRPPLKGFPQYGFKASMSGETFPKRRSD